MAVVKALLQLKANARHSGSHIVHYGIVCESGTGEAGPGELFI